MYHLRIEIDVWPSRNFVRYFMPEDFKKHIIIDGMECPVVQLKSAIAQQSTFEIQKS